MCVCVWGGGSPLVAVKSASSRVLVVTEHKEPTVPIGTERRRVLWAVVHNAVDVVLNGPVRVDGHAPVNPGPVDAHRRPHKDACA